MRTIFFMLSATLFLFCSTTLLSQQPNTVTIPGTTLDAIKTGTGYWGRSRYLGAGVNSANWIDRGYIEWNNILSYVPLGSVVTNAVFSFAWGGNQSAQLEFREFIGGTGWEEIWTNIGTGELWGTRVASTTEYSFPGLTEAVQNSVSGGNSYVIRSTVESIRKDIRRRLKDRNFR